MIKTLFQNNKEIIVGSIIILLVFGSIAYKRHRELNEHGIIVEGTIIECQMVNVSGTCVVKVEYITNEGIKKTSKNTLYQKSNCQVGKKINLQYSDVSDLTHVIEENGD